MTVCTQGLPDIAAQQERSFVDAVRSGMPTPYSTTFRSFDVVIIFVWAKLFPEKWGEWSVPELPRFVKRRGTAACTLKIRVLPIDWVDRSAFHIRRRLADLMIVGSRMIAHRCARSKFDFDRERFLHDVDAAMFAFVRASPTTKDSERIALAEWNPALVEIPDLTSLDAQAPSKPRTPPKPKRIRLVPDDSHCVHVGRLASGQLYFATQVSQYQPGTGEFNDYLAVYRFQPDGMLADAQINSLDGLGPDERDELWTRRLHELGDREAVPIEVAPFAVRRKGCTFGLVAERPEDPADGWRVSNEPGGSMVFMAPWDGCYDT